MPGGPASLLFFHCPQHLPPTPTDQYLTGPRVLWTVELPVTFQDLV